MINKQNLVYLLEASIISIMVFFIFKNYTDNIHLQYEVDYIKNILSRLNEKEQAIEDDDEDYDENNDLDLNFGDEEDYVDMSDELDGAFKRYSFSFSPDNQELPRIEELQEEIPQEIQMEQIEVPEEIQIEQLEAPQEISEEIIVPQKDIKQKSSVRQRKKKQN